MAVDPLPPNAPPEPNLDPREPASNSATLEALLHEISDDDGDIFGNRVEWKYVLSAEVATAIREEVSARLHLEEFIPGRRKTIMHSIYFDSDDFMLYRRAMLSTSSLKFRLRTYTTHGDWTKMDPQGFFECKIGSRGKKFKLRAMVPIIRAGELIGPPRPRVTGTGRLSALGDQRFMWKARRALLEFQMTARLTVSYVREAYVSENAALRITFDEQYRAARIDEGNRSPVYPPPGAVDDVIVEIKFVGQVPAWLATLMADTGLELGGQSFSKFRTGVGLTYPEQAARRTAERSS